MILDGRSLVLSCVLHPLSRLHENLSCLERQTPGNVIYTLSVRFLFDWGNWSASIPGLNSRRSRSLLWMLPVTQSTLVSEDTPLSLFQHLKTIIERVSSGDLWTLPSVIAQLGACGSLDSGLAEELAEGRTSDPLSNWTSLKDFDC